MERQEQATSAELNDSALHSKFEQCLKDEDIVVIFRILVDTFQSGTQIAVAFG